MWFGFLLDDRGGEKQGTSTEKDTIAIVAVGFLSL